MAGKRKNKSTSDENESKRVAVDASQVDVSSTTAIPIFLKKTYRMIETCDPEICTWTDDGEMFVVKNPVCGILYPVLVHAFALHKTTTNNDSSFISTQDVFSATIIPQYFDHNKFSSFARQLNFYGFRKIQTKPIRNDDFDKSTAKHVTFFNEKFKRDRYDLLKDIQRSTRGGGAQATIADQAQLVEILRNTVVALESRVQELEGRWQEMAMKTERDIQAKVELAMMDMLSTGRPPALQAQMMGLPGMQTNFGNSPASLLQRVEASFGSNMAKGFGASRTNSAQVNGGGNAAAAATASGLATLPPHPKQKNLPPQPTAGIPSNTSGGVNRNSSTQSLLLRNAWEDKFYSTLMMGDPASRTASMAGMPGAMQQQIQQQQQALAVAQAAQQLQQNQAAQQLQQSQATQHLQQNQAAQQASTGTGSRAARSQRGTSSGGKAPSAPAPAEPAVVRAAALERQTTAEILLEAAGELGKGNGGKGNKEDEKKQNVEV